MTTQGLASLALKLIGAYYLIQTITGLVGGLGSVVSLVSQLGLGVAGYAVMGVVAPGAILFGLCWLIKSSDFFAAKLVREDSPLATPQVSLRDMQAVAFSCIGLSLVASTLPEITQMSAYYYFIPKLKYGEVVFGNIDWAHSTVVGILVRLAIGLFLFLQPRGLVTLWGRLQNLRGLKDA